MFGKSKRSTCIIQQSTMVKKVEEQPQTVVPKALKGTRFQPPAQVEPTNKRTWPTNAVVYLGHLPHGFQQEQLQSYFSQYGEVLAVKLARSRTTARSKGYAFIQFKYHQIADIVSDAMNGYLLLGKVIVAHALKTQKNPFWHSSAGKYKFINWKRLYVKTQNEPKNQEQVAHLVHGLLKNQEKRRHKFKQLGIDYEFPGFSSYVPESPAPKPSKSKTPKVAKNVTEAPIESVKPLSKKSKTK